MGANGVREASAVEYRLISISWAVTRGSREGSEGYKVAMS